MEEAHFVPPPRPASTELPEWVLDYRRYALGALFVAAFTEGLSSHVGGVPLRALVAFAVASAIALYCPLDARVHGKEYLRTFQWALMFTWPVGLLLHMLWTRRARGILVYLGLAALGMAAAGLGRALAALIVAL